MRKTEQIRWSKEKAAAEFNINPRTLAGRLKNRGISPGKDNRFSTRDICAAVFGDLERERTRLASAQAKRVEIENQVSERKLVEWALVEKSWAGIILALREKILLLEIPTTRKQDILADLQTVPIEEIIVGTGTPVDDPENE